MIFNGKDVADFLAEKGIHHIHHANTYQTSGTFFNESALLSRAEVDRKGLVQTPQWSDQLDKQYGIYNDIFFDVANLSSRMGNKCNHYGPIVFKFDASLLNNYEVKITSDNPYKFKGICHDNWYINDMQTMSGYDQGCWPFCQHVVLHNTPQVSLLYLIELQIYVPATIDGCDHAALVDLYSVKEKIEKIKNFLSCKGVPVQEKSKLFATCTENDWIRFWKD